MKRSLGVMVRSRRVSRRCWTFRNSWGVLKLHWMLLDAVEIPCSSCDEQRHQAGECHQPKWRQKMDLCSFPCICFLGGCSLTLSRFAKNANLAWNLVVVGKCRQPLEEFRFGWESKLVLLCWKLFVDIGHCRGLMASYCRVALQRQGKARPSHRLSFVFCGHFTEEFGERDSKKCIILKFQSKST